MAFEVSLVAIPVVSFYTFWAEVTANAICAAAFSGLGFLALYLAAKLRMLFVPSVSQG